MTRVNYASAGASNVSFFTVPVGQSATLIRAGSAASVTKTRRDTNLEQAGHIPSKAFKIHGFSLNYVPLQQAVGGAATDDIVDDIQRLAFGGYMEFKILDKTYLYLPLNQLPGVNFSGTSTGTNNVSAGGFGTGSPRDIYVLGIPLTLDPFQSFAVTFYWDGTVALTQTFDLQFCMHGLNGEILGRVKLGEFGGNPEAGNAEPSRECKTIFGFRVAEGVTTRNDAKARFHEPPGHC